MTSLKEQYLDYLRHDISEVVIDKKTTLLTIPFLDAHNDYIQILVEQIAEDRFRLSDGGNTINDLRLSGKDATEEHIPSVIRQFCTDCYQEEIYKEADYETLPNALQAVIQSILVVNYGIKADLVL